MKTGRKRWMLDLRYLGGKREFYATEDEAKTAREVRLREVSEHGISALALSHADRVEFTLAKARLDKIGLTISRAVEFCEQHHAAVEALPISKALELLEKEKRAAGNRERSVKNLVSTVESFASSLEGDLKVSEVTRESVVAWLGGNGWAPATVRTKRIDLQTFFRGALARRWSTHDPTAKLEVETLDDRPPGILTVEQCERLLRAAVESGESRFCGWIALALFCGIRPEEIEKMEAKHVSIDRAFAEIPAHVAKTRKRRIVDLSENCRVWLRIGLELPPVNYRGRLNKVRLKAGFEGYRKKLEGGKEKWLRVPGDEWPHDCLRHSFASYHYAFFENEAKTQKQMGHRSGDMLFERYRELVTKDEAAKFWEIRP